MTSPQPPRRAGWLTAADLGALARLAAEGTGGLTDLVEAVHANVLRPGAALRGESRGRTVGLSGLVYDCVRAVSSGVGAGLGTVLTHWPPPSDRPSSDAREAWLSALNGVVGDHLHDSGNPLAIPMSFRGRGRTLSLDPESLRATLPEAGARVLVLVHGLCMNDLQWRQKGQDYGERLAHALGYTPLYLRYNTGRHISHNGREFADLLEALVAAWPVPLERLVILAHSMGGLVTRSACALAEGESARWLRSLGGLVFLGAPHHGAPYERFGNLFERTVAATPYAAPFSRLGRLRSAGITDLRFGNLLDDDWQGCDRFGDPGDRRRPVCLPRSAPSYAIAACTRLLGPATSQTAGDGLVPVMSALGLHEDPARDLGFPESRRQVVHGVNHFDLLGHPEVGSTMETWLRSLDSPRPTSTRRATESPS